MITWKLQRLICAPASYSGLRFTPLSSALLNEFGHQTRPARLMAGTQRGAKIAVKVPIKQQVIPTVGNRL